MKNIKRLLAALISTAAVLSSAASCSKKESSKSEAVPTADSTENTTEPDIPADDMEIVWLADYDLNPASDEQRSVALSIFEDTYDGKINYIPCTPQDKFSTLASMIDAGETVDMFPCEAGVFPNGVMRDWFAPLDPYFGEMDMDSGLWEDMSDIVEMFAYNGQHYIVPYSVSEPLLLTYSRKLMQSEGIDDPRKLYQEGRWNWDTMKSMIEKFMANNPAAYRFGINGWYGQAALSSTGHTVVGFDGSRLTNNIGDEAIARAVGLIAEIRANGWYSSFWRDSFPSDFNTLFYASTSWTLGISNAANPDADLMIVPFPKSPDADKNYISCNFNSRMLVNSSDKGKAVATYLKCERIAAADENHKKAAKEAAVATYKNVSGSFKSFVTEEQYDALQEYLDTSEVSPVFDFGNGMGEAMTGYGIYSPDTRGVMYRITDTEGTQPPWDALREALSPVIDSEIAGYNN